MPGVFAWGDYTRSTSRLSQSMGLGDWVAASPPPNPPGIFFFPSQAGEEGGSSQTWGWGLAFSYFVKTLRSTCPISQAVLNSIHVR